MHSWKFVGVDMKVKSRLLKESVRHVCRGGADIRLGKEERKYEIEKQGAHALLMKGEELRGRPEKVY